MRIRRHATNRIFLVGRGPPLKLVRFFERFRFPCQCHWFRSPWEHCFLLQFPAWWGYVFCFLLCCIKQTFAAVCYRVISVLPLCSAV